MTPNTTLYKTTHRTPIGELTLIASEVGLRAILWPSRSHERGSLLSQAQPRPTHPILRRTAAQLDEYFVGRRTSFDIPLDLKGTSFQRAAWQALAEIPYGGTTSYGRQAAALGMPGAARALGSANRSNPVCIVLPCHRVIGANGSLTGFAGGLALKQWLLDHEAGVLALSGKGPTVRDRDPAQQRLPIPVPSGVG
jgi:methylated-DNA-[protein]-cysteine S-methyltransferase